jgi:hypothetical protein
MYDISPGLILTCAREKLIKNKINKKKVLIDLRFIIPPHQKTFIYHYYTTYVG